MTKYQPDPSAHANPEDVARCRHCTPKPEPVVPEIKPALGIERQWDGYTVCSSSPMPYFPRRGGGFGSTGTD